MQKQHKAATNIYPIQKSGIQKDSYLLLSPPGLSGDAAAEANIASSSSKDTTSLLSISRPRPAVADF
jgi:uncharacterized Fe-S cluster-containing MiaB family protein